MTFNSNFKKSANESIGFSFIKVYNMWHAEIQEVLKEMKITHSQFVVITALGYFSQQNAQLTQVELARYINMDVMTLSKLLKKLIAMEYIERKMHETDTRAKVISLTPTGVELMKKAIVKVENVDSAFFGKLSAEEHQKFAAMLEKLGQPHE